ncbi:aldo/keto reductase [Parvularcula lutaonensis]|uniref:Aldo/keto reductase n=1 Tax=Parvularcula lutaonensis TaxID=491923 RepID=A0ABV7MH47_9PROT|nr:aldo/keto reductase [Parvularcula lutaonensis]GGY53756.1 2,5-didehydrogluconate reductase [Parvularcula lutaonensis]
MLFHRFDDIDIPRLGLGTWQLQGDDAYRIVSKALEIGYRHIDTAAVYENEEEVGRAIAESGLKREDIFLTTKLWWKDIRDGKSAEAMDKSLDRLGTDYIDLILNHWPVPGMEIKPQVEPLAEIKSAGKARLIGVSNYTQQQLLKAVTDCPERLANIQCEYHPMLNQDPVLKTARGFDMLFTSYSPIGQGKVLANPAIKRLAEWNKKDPAQIVLRWHLQQANVAAIPRTSSEEHLKSNFDIFDFELSAEDMKTVYGLMRPDGRLIDPDWAPEWDTGTSEAA